MTAAPPYSNEPQDPSPHGAEREMPFSGNSMRFLFRSGDALRFRRIAADRLLLGDIVVYVDMERRNFVAHRIVWKADRAGGHIFWTKGDRSIILDKAVPGSCIAGRVESFRRGQGRWISLQGPFRRLCHCGIGIVSTVVLGLLCAEMIRDFCLKTAAWTRDRIIDAGLALRDAYRFLRDRTLQTAAWTRDRGTDAYRFLRDRFLQTCAWTCDRGSDACRFLRDRFLQTCAWTRDRIIDACRFLRDSFLKTRAWTRDRISDACIILRDAYRSLRDACLQSGAWTRDRIFDACLALRDAYRFLRDRTLQTAAWIRDRAKEAWIALRRPAIRHTLRFLTAAHRACGLVFPRRCRALRAQIGGAWLRLDAGCPAPQRGRDIVWEGEVTLSETMVVAAGCRLSILPGTLVRSETAAAAGRAADRLAFGTRAPLPRRGHCALMVYGELDVAGEPGREVRFTGAPWGGIVLLGRSRASIRHARFDPAADFAALGVDFCRAEFRHCDFQGGQGATAWGGGASAVLHDCSFTESSKAAVWAHDDARVRLRRCRACECSTDILAEGCAVVSDSCGTYSRCRGSAATTLGHSTFLGRSSRWLDHAGQSAIFASGRARLRLRGCRLERNNVGMETLQRSRALLCGVRVEGNGTGVWTQNASQVEAVGGSWQDNREAIRCSHSSRARLRGVAFSRQAKTAIMAEDDCRVRMDGAVFTGNENGVLALRRSRLRATGNTFSNCRDTAIWADHRCRTRLSHNDYLGNGKDFHREYHPCYDSAQRSA